MTTAPDTRAAAYRRVSTDEQADSGHSFDEQRRLLQQTAAERELELVELFGDPGWSGSRMDRPDLQRLLAAADAGEFEVVLVYDLTRLSRDLIHLATIMRRLEAAGVGVETLSGDRASTSTADDELAFLARGMVGQYERRKIAERVSMAARAKAAKGEAPGGRYPLTGYRREDQRYVIVEDEARIIRRIYAEADEGHSQHRIAQHLNADGLRTPRGAAWTQGTVGRILRHPAYRGARSHKGEVVAEDAHEAIIEPKLWHRVQRVMAARDNAPGALRGRKPNADHLFICGLLRCTCGYALVPRTYRTGTAVYTCRGRIDRGTDFCDQEPIRRDLIDTAVLELFEQVGLDVETTRREFEAAVEAQLTDARVAREQAESAAQQAAEAVERVRRDYKRGALSAESHDELWPEVKAEHEAAAAEVKRLRAHEREIADTSVLADAEEATLRWLAELRDVIAGKLRDAESVEALRAALMRLFSRFELRRAPDLQVVPILREEAVMSRDPRRPAVLLTGITPPRQATRTS